MTMDSGHSREWLQTKCFVRTMQIGAKGWDVSVHDRELTQVPVVWVYVFDHATNWCWSAGVPRDDFRSNAARGREASPTDRQDFLNGIGSAVSRLKGQPPGILQSVERELATLLSLFAGTGRTVEVIDNGRDGGHFVLMNYASAPQPVLRPFAVPGDDLEPLAFDKLRSIVAAVSAADRASHPEWFAGS